MSTLSVSSTSNEMEEIEQIENNNEINNKDNQIDSESLLTEANSSNVEITPSTSSDPNTLETTSNNAKPDNSAENEDEATGSYGLKIPLARVKKIMKADPYLGLASQDAVFLIAKATELFIESLASEAYEITMSSRKKTVSRRDIDTIIDRIEALAFLEGAIDY